MASNSWVIDRFEEEYAVCENMQRETCRLNKNRIPAECKEGSCIQILEDGTIIQDLKMEEERKHSIQELMSQLFE